MNRDERPDRPGPIHLAHLIALNDEIVALSRAGLPLERGLSGIGRDVPGGLGAIAGRLGRRMEEGRSLPEAIAIEGDHLPASYRAVVAAGLRSGRLPAAMEGLASFARNYQELRRSIGLAMLYPALVLCIGYGMFLWFVLVLIPIIVEAFASMQMPIARPIVWLGRWGNWAWIWGPILPLMIVAGGIAWIVSGRAGSLASGRVGGWFRNLPGFRSIFDGMLAAQFAEWLALLLEHDVPWAEALEIAGDASGDAALGAEAHRQADLSRRGETVEEGMTSMIGMPPLLRWLMTAGRHQGAIVPALRHAAETYRLRALRRSAALQATLPVLLIVVVGGTTSVVYMLVLFYPWTSLLYNLSK